jgi:hypothetical protein
MAGGGSNSSYLLQGDSYGDRVPLSLVVVATHYQEAVGLL